MQSNSLASNEGYASGALGLTGSSAWDLGIDEDGTSFANWTSIAGTWSSDGTEIIQTDLGAGLFTAIHNTKVPTADVIFEAEIQFPSSGQAAAPNYLGLYPGVSSSVTAGTPALIVRRETVAATSSISFRPDNAVPTITYTVTITTNVWYKIRVVVSGGRTSIYLDDVLLGTVSVVDVPSGNSLDVTYIGLVTSTAKAFWRNIKVWTPSQP